MQWQWDGVDFDILYPVDDEFSGNNHSCVLQVRAGGVVTLLPGDIERSGEYRLLDNPRLAQADILLAPHHGSSSSSSATFIAQLQPQYVVFSSGYRNRFHHPNPAVEQRYREQKAELFNTATDGALIFEITHGRVAQITRTRSGRNHYWD
jgi:competence protein ComEC